jgi:predicted Zn-dependent protease
MFLAAAILCCSAASQVMPLDHAIFDQCMSSPARTAQVETMDRRNVHELLGKFGAAPVPATARRGLDRLVKASLLKGRKVALVAYTSKFLNAHEADHGVIVISSAAWSRDKDLADDEIAAMLAHEVAHLELKDSKRMACEALAYVSNDQLTLPSAIRETTREAYSGDSHLSLTLATMSQSREKAADVRGTQLLSAAGYDPLAMARMLRKLAPAGVFSSASHPAIGARIDNVLRSLGTAAAQNTIRE